MEKNTFFMNVFTFDGKHIIKSTFEEEVSTHTGKCVKKNKNTSFQYDKK